MKITLNETHINEALRLYVRMLTGQDPEGSMDLGTNHNGKYYLVVSIPDPIITKPGPAAKKVVTKEEVDTIYSAVAKRTPDVT